MIANRKNLIQDLYDGISDKSNLTSENLEILIYKAHYPDNYEVKEVIEEKLDFFDKKSYSYFVSLPKLSIFA